MIETPLVDDQDRDLARTELDKNTLVIAGAGTGKTALLIDRLTILILGKQIPVEQIVALTFTKKAAEEMRERLENRLRKLAIGEESFPLLEEKFPQSKPQWESLARKALEDIPKAQIGTIHSFAAHLLRLYPLQADVDPRFREDEGSVFESVFEKEWLAWATSELREDGPRSAFWSNILRVATLSDLRELSEGLVSPMVDLEKLREKTDLGELYDASLNQISSITERFDPSSRAHKFNAAFSALTTIYQQLKLGKTVDQNLISLLDGLDSVPKGWEGANEDLKGLKNRTRALTAVDQDLIDRAVQGVLPLVERVRSELKRVGAVSFDGLLVFARNLVRDHADVRRALKKKFSVFLVDEFQDTDPLQGEILFYLAETLDAEAGRWQEVVLGEGRLFVVGDPKQSIYRFRGADMGAFEEFQGLMENQGALRASLSSNFRSNEPILQFVNSIFPHVMRAHPFLQPPYVPLDARKRVESQPGLKTNGSLSAGPEVLMMSVGNNGSEEKLSAYEAREAEAAAIADWIEANVKENTSGALSYRDVALLFRSANAFSPYLEAFRRRGIRYLAEGEKSFYRTSEVVDFLNLLSAINDPSDTMSLVGVLRSPLGGLTDSEILDLKLLDGLSYLNSHGREFNEGRHPGESRDPVLTPVSKKHVYDLDPGFRRGDDFSSHSQVLNGKICGFLSVLRDLHIASQKMPVPDLIHEIFEKTWTLEVASRASHGEQAIANLQKIRQLAEKWREAAPLTLQKFVRRFARYRDDERDEGENPLADLKYDAVKVMTIHKAKGLEFPVVFLPNLSAGKRSSQEKPVLERDWRSGRVGLRLRQSRKTNAAMVLVEERVAEREEAEEVRVFYVASTRAKDKMICLIHSGARRGASFAEYLRNAQPLQVPVINISYTDELGKSVPQRAGTLSEEWDVKTLLPKLTRRRREHQELLGRRVFTSPTILMREPEKNVLREDEVFPRPPDPIMVGVVCHKVLEEWNFNATSKDSTPLLKRALGRAGKLFELTGNNASSRLVLDECEKIMSGFFASEVYQTLSKVKIVGREIPFLYPSKKKGEGVMHGVIDLLYETDGELIVADYKTNRVTEKNLAETAAHYQPQAEVYLEAIMRTLGRRASFELIFLRRGVSVRLNG